MRVCVCVCERERKRHSDRESESEPVLRRSQQGAVGFRVKREQLERLVEELSPERPDQNLVMTVLYAPSSLDSGPTPGTRTRR